MLLDVDDLAIDLPTPGGMAARRRPDVRSRSTTARASGWSANPGRGKTMTALALMGLAARGARGVRVRSASRAASSSASTKRRCAQLRGDRIAMIFQEPMTALNPLHSVGRAGRRALMLHRGLGRRDGARTAVELLERVRLAEPERAARSYPFALSGGERQRAMIAMAIACGPRLIIADEPTTALDVTVQARILALIDGLRSESRMAVLLVEPRSRGDRRSLRPRARDVWRA